MFRFLSSLLAAGFRKVQGRVPLLDSVSRLFLEVVEFPSVKSVVVGRLLAEGGFSFVYEATEMRGGEKCVTIKSGDAGKKFALKKLICQDSEAAVAARAEAEMHERFDHPNLLALLDKVFLPYTQNPQWEVCWLLFPLCSCSLRDEITRRVLVDEQEPTYSTWSKPLVVELIAGMCRGLQAMHRQAVAHRDVKPENVLLTSAEGDRNINGGRPLRPVLMDFGSVGPAEVSIRDRRDVLEQVEVAARLCTMQYRAPELFDAASDIGVLSFAVADVWSLGCTAFCCLQGYSPFEVEFEQLAPCKPRQVDTGHLRILGPVPWPKAGPRSDTPDWLKELVCWILTADCKTRPNIDEVLDRLSNTPCATSAAGSV